MAVGDAYVFPGFLTPVLTQLFSHASAEVRGKNTPERKVASTWDQTHNLQVMSPTRSPLSHPGRAPALVRAEKMSPDMNLVFFCLWVCFRLFIIIAHLIDAPKDGYFLPWIVQGYRTKKITVDNARIQDKPTESSIWFFIVLGI